MNELTVLLHSTKKMSSLLIAELMDKEHKNVLRDIGNLIDQGAIDRLSFEPISYLDSMNREQKMYQLDFASTMLLITGYDPKRRAMVIDRWLKLETGEAVPAALGGAVNQDNLASTVAGLVTMVARLAASQEKMASRFFTLDTRSTAGQAPSTSGNVSLFLRETFTFGGGLAVRKDLLYAAYAGYCETTGTFQETECNFYKVMYRSGLPLRRAKLTIHGERAPVVRGMNFTAEVEVD